MPKSKRITLTQEQYLAERKLYIEAEQEGARSFDKAILTLTAGSFGVSFTFIKDLGFQHYKLILVLGYSFFILSMLSTLISFLMSQKAYQVQRRNFKIYYETGEMGKENTFSGMTEFLNYSAIAFFILGLSAMTIYVSLNMLGISVCLCWY